MKISDYIVPIFMKDELNGTGFIVGNTLITAAHVVISKENVCHFLYRGNNISVGPDNIFLYEYPKEKCLQGLGNIYLDLAIYNLENLDSPLELRKPQMSDPCFYQGYSDSLHIDTYTNLYLDNRDWYYPSQEEKPISIINTYISGNGRCKKGNSGGPLFQGKHIVGMLVGNQQYQNFSMDRYIKSDYISETISNL